MGEFDRRRSTTRSLIVRLLVCAVAACSWACGDFSGGSSGGGGTVAPSEFFSLSAQAGGVDAFDSTVYPILKDYCVDCHAGGGPGSPHIAHPNRDTAYHAVVDQGKVNLGDPSASRLVVKIAALSHHCWTNCAADGASLQAAIEQWASLVDFGTGGVSVDGALASNDVAFRSGVVDTGSERYNANAIAIYEFKEGSGFTATDTSGVEPAASLNLAGDELNWLSNWGIEIVDGGLFANLAGSRKFYDQIADVVTGTSQYSIEAWMVADNIDQEGPARIVSYSQGTGQRNFTLGQVQYNFNFRNRSINPALENDGSNGTPALQTNDADQDLQDRLQHVVVTYDQFRGRRVYVGGVFTDDHDELGPARLWNWSRDYIFVIGNETTDNRQWQGQIRFVAIYKQALTDAQIVQNFQAGVGERLLLRFDLSQWIPSGVAEFIVSDFDEYSYLFCQPNIRTSGPNGSRISNLRIAVNGVVAPTGQAFATLETTLNGTRQELSRVCGVIPKGTLGPDGDTFALVFEHLGGFQNVVVEDPPPPADIILDPDPVPYEGTRDFARVNAAFARVTDLDPSVGAVTLAEIEQQLPSGYDLRSFVSSNQVGIAKLSLEYCDALVESPTDRASYFPGVDFDSAPDVALAGAIERNRVYDALFDRMVGDALAFQPTRTEVRAALDIMVDALTAICATSTCDATRTRTIVKGACAAVASSAAVGLY